MVGFHLSGDPDFPNQGNCGWIEAEPEEDLEELFEEEGPKEAKEEFEDKEEEEEPEEEVFNPHYIARVSSNRLGYNGHEHRWATVIERWSRPQR